MSEKDISKAVVLFDHILDFNDTDFPRPLVEMREPFVVKSLLEKHHSEKEVNKIMCKNFGLNWEYEYRKRLGILPKTE